MRGDGRRRVAFGRAVPRISRDPSSEERAAATKMAAKLRKVVYPSRQRTKVLTPEPPGRINSRELVRLAQQIDSGIPITAKPFRIVKRAKTIHTPIKVGIMCDVSGSMARAQLPLAVTSWALADALHQVQGKVSVVLFGTNAYPIHSSRDRVTKIEVYDATGSHEDFESGFSLIDADLNFFDEDGARLLVIITDGHFVLESATDYAEYVMEMCRRKNIGVIWVDISGYFARPHDRFGNGELLNVKGMDATEIAEALGEKVIEEFRRVAPQHS